LGYLLKIFISDISIARGLTRMQRIFADKKSALIRKNPRHPRSILIRIIPEPKP